MIETLDDIIEQLADLLAVYGAHSERCESGRLICRCCFASRLKARIMAAVDMEIIIRGSQVNYPPVWNIEGTALGEKFKEHLEKSKQKSKQNDSKAG